MNVANPSAALADLWLPTLAVQRSTLGGTDNNFVIDAPYLWLLCAPASSACILTGLAFPSGNVDGSRVVIENTGTSWPILLSDQDAGSSAENRFFSPATIVPGYRAVAMYDGTTARWRLSTDPIAIYPTTLATVVNTTTETTVLSFVVPAGAWRDGHMIQIALTYALVNTTGSDRTFDFQYAVGAGSDANILSSQSVPNGTSSSVFTLISMMRRDTSIIELLAQNQSSPANFTASQTVTLKVTLSVASANFSIIPIAAQVIHYKGES